MVDIVKLKIKAGNGGDGIVSWHHEKFKPKGGPDGGSGGSGGSVYLVADPNLSDLSHLSGLGNVRAEDGGRGGKNNCTGRGAKDVVVKVPVGTLVGAQRAAPVIAGRARSAPTDTIADLTEAGQRVLVAQGGVGGRGNESFKSATNQRPLEHTLGTLGEERQIKLELKMLADVGIIGLPSSGKTSLLNALTSAKGRVGAYPFTTLEPNVGILKLGPRVEAPEDDRVERVVIADIPGLIEGAAEGKGLGDEFLRHIERCKVLVHLVEITNNKKQITSNYRIVRKELGEWSPKLLKKPEIVVISKVDSVKNNKKQITKSKYLSVSTVTGEGLPELVTEIYNRVGAHHDAPETDGSRASLARRPLRKGGLRISTVTGEGLPELVAEIVKVLGERGEQEGKEEPEEKEGQGSVGKIFDLGSLPNKRMVFGKKVLRRRKICFANQRLAVNL